MQTPQQASGMLKVAEVAEMTGLSEATVLREVHNGEFEAFRVGPGEKHIRITRESAQAYLERRRISSNATATPTPSVSAA